MKAGELTRKPVWSVLVLGDVVLLEVPPPATGMNPELVVPTGAAGPLATRGGEPLLLGLEGFLTDPEAGRWRISFLKPRLSVLVKG